MKEEKKENIFEITTKPYGCPFFTQKVVGVLVIKVKRDPHIYGDEAKKLKVPPFFIQTVPISISDDDFTCNIDLNDNDEIVGLIPVDDCYEVQGCGEKGVYEQLGFITGKSTPIDEEYWELSRKRHFKEGKTKDEEKIT